MTTTPYELIEKERAERAARKATETDKSTSPIWTMPDSLSISMQFVTDPLDYANMATYREAYCPEFKHVSGEWSDGPYAGQPRADIPFSARDVVVFDTTVDKKVGLKYGHPDKIDVNGVEMEVLSEILDGSSVTWADRDGNPKAGWKMLFNVVIHDWPDTKNKKGYDRRHPQPGDHILLKFREGDWRDHIAPALRARRDREKTDIMAHTWEITITPANKKTGQARMVTVAISGPATPLEVDPIDANAEVAAIRASFEALVRAVHADYIGMNEIPEPPEWAQDATDAEGVTPVDLMSVQALKAELDKLGVTYPEKVSRAKLLALYKKELEPPF